MSRTDTEATSRLEVRSQEGYRLSDETDQPPEYIDIPMPKEYFYPVLTEILYHQGEPTTDLLTRDRWYFGTGFYYRIDGTDFLVTARHIFAGRTWRENKPREDYQVTPTHVRITVRGGIVKTCGSSAFGRGRFIAVGGRGCSALSWWMALSTARRSVRSTPGSVGDLFCGPTRLRCRRHRGRRAGSVDRVDDLADPVGRCRVG